MDLKQRVNASNVDKMTTRELYAAWGTTEEKHLNRMFEFIKRQNEKITGKAEIPHEAQVVRVENVAAAEVADTSRTAARRVSGLGGRKVAVVSRAKAGRFAEARMAAKKTALGLEELEMKGLEDDGLVVLRAHKAASTAGCGRYGKKKAAFKKMTKGKKRFGGKK